MLLAEVRLGVQPSVQITLLHRRWQLLTATAPAVAAPMQGLSRHMMGRSWRLGSGAGQPSEMAQLLRWLHDTPRPDSPFSVHNLCSAHGVHGWVGRC